MISISICIPTYNYGCYLRASVLSFLKSGVKNIEIMILDDCSQDDTQPIAEELMRLDERVTYRRHKENLGHITTFNEGLRWASKDFLLIMSADDVFYGKHLLKRLQFLDDHPNIAFSFSPIRMFFGSNRQSYVHSSPLQEMSQTQILTGEQFLRLSLTTRQCLPPAPSTIVRTSFQRIAGEYNSKLVIAEDLEMWLRLACLGDVGYHPYVSALYRRHQYNLSSTTILTDRLHAYTAFKSVLPAITERYPELATTWHSVQYSWATDFYKAANSARELGAFEDAAILARYARRIDQGFGNCFPALRLRVRELLGEVLWRKIRSMVRKRNVIPDEEV